MSEAMDTHGFFRIGNHAAVDFVNTTVILDGAETDLCTTWDRVVLWALGAGLVTASERRKLAPSDRDATHWHGKAMELRAALRDGFEKFSRDGTLSGEHVRTVNEHLSAETAGVQLRRGAAGFVLEPAEQPVTPSRVLARIARQAADMFSADQHTRLRHCAGEHCVLWFFDTSKNGTRRWCSMEGCGNRAKVSTHYRRHKD